MLRKHLLFAVLVLLCTSQLVQLKPPTKALSSFDENYDEDLPNDEGSNEEYEEEEEEVGNTESNGSKEVEKAVEDAKIISTPRDVTLLAGDRVEFECKNDKENDKDKASFVTQWFHDDKMIYQDDLFALDNHLKKHYNKSENALFIYNIDASDAGKYICKVMGTGSKILKITHVLTVKMPAKIVKILPNDNYLARENEPLNLACEASGIPPPKLTWIKDGNRFPESPDQFNLSTYSIPKIRIHDAGTYQCVADNKVGDPASAEITIKVQHKPHVTIEKTTISSEKDYTSVLTCTSHANPAAITEWFKNGQRIVEDGTKYNVTEHGHLHTLFIINTQTSDFGKYTCESKNHLGVTKKDIILTGVPVPISLIVQTNANTPIYRFSFQSVAPITSYDLQFKKFDDRHFTPILDVEIKNPVGVIYSSQYDTPKPIEDGPYQSRIRAKNTYGWSEWSDVASYSVNNDEPKPENISTSSASTPTSPLTLTTLLMSIYYTLNRLNQ